MSIFCAASGTCSTARVTLSAASSGFYASRGIVLCRACGARAPHSPRRQKESATPDLQAGRYRPCRCSNCALPCRSSSTAAGCFRTRLPAGRNAQPRNQSRRRTRMAQAPLATRGNYLHIYDFRVQKGHEQEFIKLFEEFDYSDANPMHKSKAQVKDGVLCRDTEDPQRFFLIAEWSDIDEHARIRRILANEIRPEFIKYIEGGKFVPKYVEVVSSTPDDILNKAAAAE